MSICRRKTIRVGLFSLPFQQHKCQCPALRETSVLAESQTGLLVKADNVQRKQAAETRRLNCALLTALSWKLFLSAELGVWVFLKISVLDKIGCSGIKCSGL